MGGGAKTRTEAGSEAAGGVRGEYETVKANGTLGRVSPFLGSEYARQCLFAMVKATLPRSTGNPQAGVQGNVSCSVPDHSLKEKKGEAVSDFGTP